MFGSIALIAILFCVSSEGRPIETVSISRANNYLSSRLLQSLYSNADNVFYSPFSISTAFGMLYMGAKNQTANEMRQVLGYDYGLILNEDISEQFNKVLNQIESFDSSKYQMSVANKIVTQKNFHILSSFSSDVRKYFHSSVETVDFSLNPIAATDSINEWAKHQTHGMIDKLLSEPLGKSTRLVVLNAIYFKGIWKTKFLKNQTQEEVFFNKGIDELRTPMMRRLGNFNYTEIPEIDSKLIEMTYSGDDVSLYVVLPNQRQGLQKLNSQLNDFSVIEKGISQLRELQVEVTLPRFKIQGSYSLKKQLSDLGMKQIFTSNADLSGIDGNRDLEVSQVIHKAAIEVNEEGSEAAAATAIITVKTSAISREPRIKTFKADHPFTFFIRDNRNGMILFSGNVNKL